MLIELEKIALSNDYLVSRKLYPNVGLVMARTIGRIAQWSEMIADPE